MPTSRETQSENAGMGAADAIDRARAAAQEQYVHAIIKEAIKPEGGFTSTLKRLKKGKFPAPTMSSVTGGVVEVSPSGRVEAALETDGGRMVIQDGRRTDRESTDPQSVSSNKDASLDVAASSDPITSDRLLSQLKDVRANPPCSLICEIELVHFDAAQRQVLLPLLWQYILDRRNSNFREELVAVGAAIRKYIAIMPMDQMGELATLLESGHRSPLPIELEIEVAKMVYRNFEVHPPVDPDPHPELAQRLWEMVQAYINPRVLLRDRHSAAASLAIEAIVAMRSRLADRAWQAAVACPYRWFGELVSDDLDGLRERWNGKSPEAAAWLSALQKNVAVQA
jgi:hypothetical protein